MLTTTDFSRHFLSLIGAAALVLQAACTVKPATGEQSFTGFMSVEDEKRIGAQEHPKIMHQFGGAYDDPKIPAHVAELGFRLLRVHYNTIRPHSALGYRPPAPEIIVLGEELPMSHEAA